MQPLDRRRFLGLCAGAAGLSLLPRNAPAAVQTETPLHGISAFGDLKYAEGFSHFDYLNPDAPKGGTFNFSPPNWYHNQSVLTFNTLNSFVPRGDAPPRMEMCFDSLMVAALDEPDARYGRLASTITISADRNSFTFAMRPEARFHDGSPLTADDAAFTFNLLKEKGHPDFVLPLAELAEAVALDPATLRLTFTGRQSSRVIFTVVGFPILSKASLEGKDFSGRGMEQLLGSGPYRVGFVSAGRTIEYERVADYWGRDFGFSRGQYNFDRLRIEFYRDRQAAFEAFKKGEILYRQEFTARVWATGYDFPALNEGRVVKREFPSEKRPALQAWALNGRRAQFQDLRVRQAIGMCFDFEWTNRNMFFDAYTRSQSPFERSEFKAEGAPGPEELALMERFRGRIPEEAFGEAIVQPVSDGSGRDRRLLRDARRLLEEAGWKPQAGLLVNERGETLKLQILVQDEVFVRVDTPFVENMRAIGIDASIRLVDSSQFQARRIDFDFDMIGVASSFSPTPTQDSLRSFFHSASASLPSSSNLAGIADPAVDELVDLSGTVDSREELVTVLRVLDRVLRARRDWIPNWHAANHRAAFWDMFGFKEPKPDYGFPVEAMWWFDEAKAKAIGRA